MSDASVEQAHLDVFARGNAQGQAGLEGIEVCRALRTFSDCYVVMLTARDDELDKVYNYYMEEIFADEDEGSDGGAEE